jgi:hypothetical protein
MGNHLQLIRGETVRLGFGYRGIRSHSSETNRQPDARDMGTPAGLPTLTRVVSRRSAFQQIAEASGRSVATATPTSYARQKSALR